MIKKIFYFCLPIIISCLVFIWAEDKGENVLVYPIFVSELENPNDFNLFATAGWDGGWGVGYDRGWVSKLPPLSNKERFKRAYLGAKLGRAKKDYSGRIYISVNSLPSWEKDNSYFLVSTNDIPMDETGEAQWFWVEVPLFAVSASTWNYVSLWSPDEALHYERSSSTATASFFSSPILAGGESGSSIVNSWLCSDIRGYPPTSLKTYVTVYEPALAIKLVPENEEQINLKLINIKDKEIISDEKIIIVSVGGRDVEKVWLQSSKDLKNKDWQKCSRFQCSAPYIFTLKKESLNGSKKIFIRAAAKDIFENKGYSTKIELIIK